MEPLGSARGAFRAPRSTGWEPLLYMKRMCCLVDRYQRFRGISSFFLQGNRRHQHFMVLAAPIPWPPVLYLSPSSQCGLFLNSKHGGNISILHTTGLQIPEQNRFYILRLCALDDRASIPSRNTELSYLQGNQPRCTSSPPVGTEVSFLEIRRSALKTHNSPPSGIEVTNACRFSYILPSLFGVVRN